MVTNLIRPEYGTFARGCFSKRPNLWKGLVGCWKPSLGITGMTLKDVSGHDNHGILTNMNVADWVLSGNPKLPGYVLNYSGHPDHVNLETPDILNSLQVPMTIVGWFNESGATPFPTIFSQYKATSGSRLIKLVRLDNNKLNYFTSTSTGGIQSNAMSITHNQSIWHYFAITISGTIASPSLTMMLDNIIESFGMSALSSSPDTSVKVQIGNAEVGQSAEAFNGQLGIILVYNRTLLLSERQDLYQYPNAMFQDRGIGGVIVAGRLMGALAGQGGLAGIGGIAGQKGGLAG